MHHKHWKGKFFQKQITKHFMHVVEKKFVAKKFHASPISWKTLSGSSLCQKDKKLNANIQNKI